MVKWAVELGEFDLSYQPRPAIKAQALADFLVEFTVTEDNSGPWNEAEVTTST